MSHHQEHGQIVILNGAPRSGKSSIANVIQNTFDGVWMNMGVDRFMQMTPACYQPGIGLRPGGERPDLEPLITTLYSAMYASIAAHSRLGLNVVVDVGHHDDYSMPLGILSKCARILSGLPVLFVGVRCPLEVVMQRRIATWKAGYEADGSVPKPVSVWQTAVHSHGIYDLEVDTARLSAEACAEIIRKRLEAGEPFSAFKTIETIPQGGIVTPIMEEVLSRMKHKHGRIIDGRRHFWDVEKLWALSEKEPVHTIKIDSIQELDQDCWFTGSRNTPIPSIRNVALHSQRIINANMDYPILLCADGQLIDGGHRIASALIDGKSEIDAVYITLPTADVIQ